MSLLTPYLYLTIAAFRIDELFPGKDIVIIIIESFFLVSMILKFFVDYQIEGLTLPEQDLSNIASNYFKGEFLLDFIPLVPLHLIHWTRHREVLFLLTKTLRLHQGFKLLDVQRIMKWVKMKYKQKLQDLVD